TSLTELDDLLALIDPDQDADPDVMAAPRGRTGGERSPSLPDGWLDSPYLEAADAACVREAELSVSGG
ncbi:MAG: tRNA dihydrouridine synthase DusB, partial [Actinomycetota bacterium]